MKTILGLTEKITIFADSKERTAIARIDTGASKSSIDRELAHKLGLNNVLKTTKIRSASAGIKERPVIKVKIKIKGKVISGYFTLADRHEMLYRVLIGRNILRKENFLIDPSIK
ncbi:RimK/LysX family protein [Candidatus Woesearchaeota archaeon]|nr:RimK/LysX family protein [Candidatus Woesearchaeota archaeon]MBW3018491.1 RimK/LysX family protein [Candidatus Woesearchaeota archaeon]